MSAAAISKPAARERPILFSGDMVRAIIEGRKTQTRRAMKEQPGVLGSVRPIEDEWLLERWPQQERAFGNFGRTKRLRCPYGQPGDRLWVRETFRAFDDGDTFYRADGDYVPVHADDEPEDWRWSPGIHMPRKQSRLTLEIVQVRVERVQEISDEDAIAEGCPASNGEASPSPYYKPRLLYMCIWDKINLKRGLGWEQNPWVWCLAFKVIK